MPWRNKSPTSRMWPMVHSALLQLRSPGMQDQGTRGPAVDDEDDADSEAGEEDRAAHTKLISTIAKVKAEVAAMDDHRHLVINDIADNQGQAPVCIPSVPLVSLRERAWPGQKKARLRTGGWWRPDAEHSAGGGGGGGAVRPQSGAGATGPPGAAGEPAVDDCV
eukprot:EG_transcript_28369